MSNSPLLSAKLRFGIDVGMRRTEAQVSEMPRRKSLATLGHAGKRPWSTGFLDLRGKLRGSDDSRSIPLSRSAMTPAPPCSRNWVSCRNESWQRYGGDAPLILPAVDAQAICVGGCRAGPVFLSDVWSRMKSEAILKIADTLNQRVIGQRHGARRTDRQAIQTNRAKLDNPDKPIGVFAAGRSIWRWQNQRNSADPCGTLYGSEQNMITINMSEFQGRIRSPRLGAPPGYVGYGEGAFGQKRCRKPQRGAAQAKVEGA